MRHQLCAKGLVSRLLAHICLYCALVWLLGASVSMSLSMLVSLPVLVSLLCVAVVERHQHHRVRARSRCAAPFGSRQLHCASLSWGVLRGGFVVVQGISCVFMGISVVASSCRVVVRCSRFGLELCDRCGGRHHPALLCAGLVEAFHVSIPVHLASCIMAVWRSSVCLGLMDLEFV